MRRRHLLHPSRGRLTRWLDAEPDDDPRLTHHVETCDRCATLLDDLAAGTVPMPSQGSGHAAEVFGSVDAGGAPIGTGGALAVAIRDAWAVPAELPDRIHQAVGRRERADRELELLIGLVSIAKDTAELLLPSEDEREEPT
ncbi:MAG: hypothetical protein AAFP84_11125 [Actinomycetota bacterium]